MAAVNPWAELREAENVTLVWAKLPAGVQGLYIDRPPTILLDTGLSRVERNATLCHELVHHHRGLTGDPRLDERDVDNEVARRLVPLDELAELVAAICDDGTPVMAWEIAEAFDVPQRVAERACELLRRAR